MHAIANINILIINDFANNVEDVSILTITNKNILEINNKIESVNCDVYEVLMLIIINKLYVELVLIIQIKIISIIFFA